jgi:regulator of replication initiation timing
VSSSGYHEASQTDQKETSLAEILLELEFIKKELYSSISQAKQLTQEKQKLRVQVESLEDEIELTIHSYKSVLETNATDTESDVGRARLQVQSL